MGERHGWLFEPVFNRSIKIRQADPRITSDAGALLLREVDHRLGLTADLAGHLYDPRDPDRIRYEQVELLRQHLYGLALGHAHQDDQDALAHDVGMKLAVWDRPGRRVIEERLASQPSDWRLVNRLSSKAQRRALNEALPAWVSRHQRAAGGGRKVVRGTLDIDPFPIEVHGSQPGGAWHGHYQCKMYYPIVAGFCAGGDYQSPRLGEGFVHAILRRGNCGGAEGAVRFVKEAIRKARDLATHLDARIDAGLVEGKVLDAIDEEGVNFVGRIKSNDVLERLAAPHLGRPPGRPTKDGDQFAIELGQYRAGSWKRSYRLVLVVIDLPDPKTGFRELFPHYFFLVTNWSIERRRARDLVDHYRKRVQRRDRSRPAGRDVRGQRDEPAPEAPGVQPGRDDPGRTGRLQRVRLGSAARAAHGPEGRGAGCGARPANPSGRGQGGGSALGQAAGPRDTMVAGRHLGPGLLRPPPRSQTTSLDASAGPRPPVPGPAGMRGPTTRLLGQRG